MKLKLKDGQEIEITEYSQTHFVISYNSKEEILSIEEQLTDYNLSEACYMDNDVVLEKIMNKCLSGATFDYVKKRVKYLMADVHSKEYYEQEQKIQELQRCRDEAQSTINELIEVIIPGIVGTI